MDTSATKITNDIHIICNAYKGPPEDAVTGKVKLTLNNREYRLTVFEKDGIIGVSTPYGYQYIQLEPSEPEHDGHKYPLPKGILISVNGRKSMVHWKLIQARHLFHIAGLSPHDDLKLRPVRHPYISYGPDEWIPVTIQCDFVASREK